MANSFEEIGIGVEEFDLFNVEYIGLIKGINGFVRYLRNKKSS